MPCIDSYEAIKYHLFYKLIFIYTGKTSKIPKLDKHWKVLGKTLEKYWEIIGNLIGIQTLGKELHLPTLESHLLVFQGWKSTFNLPRLVNVMKVQLENNVAKVGT